MRSLHLAPRGRKATCPHGWRALIKFFAVPRNFAG
jgi:hypothetical protein